MSRARVVTLGLALAVAATVAIVLVSSGDPPSKEQLALNSWAKAYGNRDDKQIGSAFRDLHSELQRANPTDGPILASCAAGERAFRQIDAQPLPPGSSIGIAYARMRAAGTASFSDCTAAFRATTTTKRKVELQMLASELTTFLGQDRRFLAEVRAEGLTESSPS